MSDELAAELTRRFAAAREPLAGTEFVADAVAKIDRVRRTRMARQALVIAVILTIVAYNMRSVLETGEFLVRVVGEIGQLGWAVSMLFGAWVVLRARKSRR